MNRKYLKRLIAMTLYGALICLASCGTDDDDTATTTSTTGFSAQFKTSCALSACHGSTGTNGPKTNLSTFAKQTSVTLDVFKAVVREGKGAMPKFTTSTYSDADLAADFAYFSAL